MGEHVEPDVEFIITESHGPHALSTAKNTGAQISKGDIVLFLDDDAELREDYIKTLAQSYREHDSPNLAGIAGFDKEINGRGRAWISRIFSVLFFIMQKDGGLTALAFSQEMQR
jgi:glycosyltransferase involved in cell wall biosynthesis